MKKILSLFLLLGIFISNAAAQIDWLDAPSLKEAYGEYFYIGFATPDRMLKNRMVQNGLNYHADCITMENEFKPDFIFAWQTPTTYTDFTGEDGNTYKVPKNFPNFNGMNELMANAKKAGVKMRGHVLVWHSQTPDWFFREDYRKGKALVDKDTMNARMEWYIKSVLENVKAWEDKNNDGERIIFAWDVVNEAVSDNPTLKQYLRTNGSNWYSIYKDESFIINAFRYANKYAPKDVLLVYNDYGCSSIAKNKAIMKLVENIKATPDARIDAVGMQTHVSIGNPRISGGLGTFEGAIQNFLSLGVDVQITEMDLSNGDSPYDGEAQRGAYKEYFEVFLRNRKTAEKNGIMGVTFWGLLDEQSWIYKPNNGSKIYHKPLLFEAGFETKPALFGVIDAVESIK